MKKLLLIIVVVVLTSAVNTSCSKDKDNVTNPIVGTWEMTDGDFSLEFTFNANYSGTLKTTDTGVTDTISFTYSIEGNQISIMWGGETDYATFTVSGNTLTIVVDGETLIFTSS